MTVDELLSDLFNNAPKDKYLFYRVYKAAIEILTKSGSGRIGERKLNEEEANKVVDYYIKIFRIQYGSILMDIGLERTGQGERMEYTETDKSITYVGLTSCLGITIPHVFGIHLAIDILHKDIYAARLKWLRENYKERVLTICADAGGAVYNHVQYLRAELPENEDAKWFIELLYDNDLYTLVEADENGIYIFE